MTVVNKKIRRCAATTHLHGTINVLSVHTAAIHAEHLESVYEAVQQTSEHEEQQRSLLA